MRLRIHRYVVASFFHLLVFCFIQNYTVRLSNVDDGDELK